MASPSPPRSPYASAQDHGGSNGALNSLLQSGTESLRTSPLGSKYARRLQLRNAHFRALPTRKVTPKSMISSSATCPSTGGTYAAHLSDLENISPCGKSRNRVKNSLGGVRESNSILQDVGNSSTVRQANRSRPRVASKKRLSTERGQSSEDFDIGSPPAPRSSRIRSRSKRTTGAMARPRRSVSGGMQRYVDHLEGRLSEAQAQLSAVTSPTATRAESTRMRHLNAETKHLQDELTAWEEKYEERIQAEVDKHFQVEASLRARIRALEDVSEGAKFKVLGLETQLETANRNLDAVETANVNLEKRIEIMSELLASSPSKIDLHAETPFRKRNDRQQSMLPHFPTAGSLARSPERQASTQAMSPPQTHLRHSPGIPVSPGNLNRSPEVGSSDEESNVSATSFDTGSAYTTQDESRPRRRMRRFGAGSRRPKPLILPSTSYCELKPASAAPCSEHDQRVGAFSFSPPPRDHAHYSPLPPRRRSSTEAGVLSTLESSPSPTFHSNFDVDDEHQCTSGLEAPLLSPADFCSTPREISSIESTLGDHVGRNLMEELSAVRRPDSDTGSEHMLTEAAEREALEGEFETLADLRITHNVTKQEPDSPPPEYTNVNAAPSAPLESRFMSRSSTAVATSTATGTIHQVQAAELYPIVSSRASSGSFGASTDCSPSTLDKLRSIFGDMFRTLRSPVELARHLVQAAQARMRIPRPLLTVQWWLVGVLLGPMARSRMLDRSGSEEGQSSIQDREPGIEDLAYGVAYITPQGSPSPIRARSLVAGKGKKRSSSADAKIMVFQNAKSCSHHQHRYKHSPLLWLKFSLTLAFAVGVAFKDGPSSLLKEAAWQCTKKSFGGSWRKARRDEILETPSPKRWDGSG